MIKRHVLKAISWGIVVSGNTMLLAWLIFSNARNAISLGFIELVVIMILYFFHDRIWQSIKFGMPAKTAVARNIREENQPNLFKQTTHHKYRQEGGKPTFTIWLTGLSGSGKSTIATQLDNWFYNNKIRAYVLDGDNTRLGINSDLSFSKDDRTENIRRVAEMSKLLNEAGTIVIASFISPFQADRLAAKNIIGGDNFIEIYLNSSFEICKQRDTKGLYKLAEKGLIKDFTGIDSPYDVPSQPDIHLKTDTDSIDTCITIIIDFLLSHERVIAPNPVLR